MLTINEIQDQIVEEFSAFDDWMDRYNYLIELSHDAKPLDAADKVDSNLIQGCQSRVWITATYQDGLIYFCAESDALIVKGLVALLLRVYNGHSPAEIQASEPYFIDKIGMKENLSPTRANGLVSMIKQIKLYALAFSMK